MVTLVKDIAGPIASEGNSWFGVVGNCSFKLIFIMIILYLLIKEQKHFSTLFFLFYVSCPHREDEHIQRFR